jgi:hypothetical protein
MRRLAPVVGVAVLSLLVACTKPTSGGQPSASASVQNSGKTNLTQGGSLGSRHSPSQSGAPAPAVQEEQEDRTQYRVPESNSTRTVDTSHQTAVATKDNPPAGATKVDFTTYVSSGNPGGPAYVSSNVPDISGADAPNGLALHTGNRYIDVVNGGAATRYDPTSIFPAAFLGGMCCDQVVIYVPKLEKFVWYMQYLVDGSGKGGFRLATATPADIQSNMQTAWSYWDFASDYFGVGSTLVDYPDLSYTDANLVGTTNLQGKGRVVFRIGLSALSSGGTISADYTSPADSPESMFHYSHLAQEGGNTAFWAGHVDTATIRVFSLADGGGSYSSHDVAVAKWPETTYSSVGLDGTDWLDSPWADNEISGAAREGSKLWLAWTATAGQATPNGFNFPNAHVRVVAIDVTTWTTVSEMQVWNPDYAFGYPFLDTDTKGELGIIVGWGGKHDNANTAEGIIGDYVVWFHNGSDKTPDRFGDYITIRRSATSEDKFAAFGYYTVKDSSVPAGYLFTPYYSLFSH